MRLGESAEFKDARESMEEDLDNGMLESMSDCNVGMGEQEGPGMDDDSQKMSGGGTSDSRTAVSRISDGGDNRKGCGGIVTLGRSG